MPNFTHYHIDGVAYARVTSILKATEPPAATRRLNAWKQRQGEVESKRKSEEATTRGTAFHAMCEAYLRGLEVACPNALALPYWRSMQTEIDNITDVIALETRVHHKTLKYAGSFDCFGTYNGVSNTVIDFKTAGKSKEKAWITDYFIQCAAYAGALASEYGYPVNQADVLIALPDQPCQKFVLSKDELLYYWGLWMQRLELFGRIAA